MDNKFMFLVLVFFLVLGSFATAVLFDQNSTLRARATNTCQPALSTSFMTSFPKDVPPGEPCEVNVFTRCEDESAVTGADIVISVANGTVDNPASQTDENGRATFTVTPQGLAEISATINGTLQITNKVTCGTQ